MSKNKRKINKKILRRSTDKFRLRVFKSNTNIYAQLFNDNTNQTIISDSSLKFEYGGNIDAARKLGLNFSKLLFDKNIKNIYFDRANYVYKGRIKAFCESLREAGFKL